jgi:hypothetical protein
MIIPLLSSSGPEEWAINPFHPVAPPMIIAFSILRCPSSIGLQSSANSAVAKACRKRWLTRLSSALAHTVVKRTVLQLWMGHTVCCTRVPRKFRTVSPLVRLAEVYTQYSCKCFMRLLESRSILDGIPSIYRNYRINGSLLACLISCQCHSVKCFTDTQFIQPKSSVILCGSH